MGLVAFERSPSGPFYAPSTGFPFTPAWNPYRGHLCLTTQPKDAVFQYHNVSLEGSTHKFLWDSKLIRNLTKPTLLLLDNLRFGRISPTATQGIFDLPHLLLWVPMVREAENCTQTLCLIVCQRSDPFGLFRAEKRNHGMNRTKTRTVSWFYNQLWTMPQFAFLKLSSMPSRINILKHPPLSPPT